MIKIEELCKLYSVKDKGKKWYSEKELRLKLLNMYYFMCNEYGKANIWAMNPKELLDNVDLLIEKKLFNESDLISVGKVFTGKAKDIKDFGDFKKD